MDRGAIRRRLTVGVAVLAASAVLALVSPGSAQAASTSCSGRKVRTLSFATGSVQVYRRGDYVCAVTVPRKPGARRRMSVSVQARGGRPVVDSGRFTRHAGPVTVHAGHRCVLFRGSVGSGSVNSGWILC
ncbi:hypothetical protein [Streptomyces sp. M41(2017)]|uniref:hypothetical protein n=1 Tax=unclassified Streptomyces TaxID=2593676 RepID=UPI0009C16A19|nr:hypothetical protein [Streptomyces sp. M41(2017)]OQQ16464.1 hypothetical protein B0675_04240 [Streptomyces sp. M41(2017)]